MSRLARIIQAAKTEGPSVSATSVLTVRKLLSALESGCNPRSHFYLSHDPEGNGESPIQNIDKDSHPNKVVFWPGYQARIRTIDVIDAMKRLNRMGMGNFVVVQMKDPEGNWCFSSSRVKSEERKNRTTLIPAGQRRRDP